jgi:hypothetical protein
MSSFGGYSSVVEIFLSIHGDCVSVAQLGPDFLLFDTPISYPPGEGELRLRVDQNETRWKVFFPGGISCDSKRVPIEACPPTAERNAQI